MNMFLAKLDMFMANLGMFLEGAGATEPTQSTTAANTPEWVTLLIESVKKIIGPILIVAATAGILYAVVVGVKFVKADTKEEREEAKQKLITVIIGIVVTIVLIALFYWLSWAIDTGKITFDDSKIFNRE